MNGAIALVLKKADVLRELAEKLKKNGLTVSDCAKGFRMSMMFKRYGIKEDELEDGITYFLKEIYSKCIEIDLTLQKAFMYIYDILEYSKEISISQIPQYLKKRIEEKEELEIMKNLTKKINNLENIQKEKEQEIQRLKKLQKKCPKIIDYFL